MVSCEPVEIYGQLMRVITTCMNIVTDDKLIWNFRSFLLKLTVE